MMARTTVRERWIRDYRIVTERQPYRCEWAVFPVLRGIGVGNSGKPLFIPKNISETNKRRSDIEKCYCVYKGNAGLTFATLIPAYLWQMLYGRDPMALTMASYDYLSITMDSHG